MSTVLDDLRQLNVRKQREAREEAKDTDSSTVVNTTSSTVGSTTEEESPLESVSPPLSEPTPVEELERFEVAASPPIKTARKPVGSKDSSIVGSTVVNTTGSIVVLPTGIDPLKAALIAALQAPLPPVPEGKKPVMIVSSTKARTEIWERLELARQLTGKDKQDIIGEALLDYFAKITRNGGAE